MILDVPDEIHIFRYLCHSQAVERYVKLVTETSAAVCGNDTRDGFIRSRIESRTELRTELPKFETEGQYRKVL